MSYGTPADVAALARIWTENGSWSATTNPTSTTVQTWLDRLSAQMDLALKANWFPAPVDETDNPTAYKAIAQYICSLAADQAHLVNGVDREVSPAGKILKDMIAWVDSNADGFVADGLAQTPTPSVKRQAMFRTIAGYD